MRLERKLQQLDKEQRKFKVVEDFQWGQAIKFCGMIAKAEENQELARLATVGKEKPFLLLARKPFFFAELPWCLLR